MTPLTPTEIERKAFEATLIALELQKIGAEARAYRILEQDAQTPHTKGLQRAARQYLKQKNRA